MSTGLEILLPPPPPPPPTLRRPRVAVVQRVVLRYRESFWNHLRRVLDDVGIDLALVHNNSSLHTDADVDVADLPWSVDVPAREFGPGRAKLVAQSLPLSLQGADLVIVEQASRLLANYQLLFGRRPPGQRIALWGHGHNFDERSHPAGEWVKRRLLLRHDWFFAYTDEVARYLVDQGFPSPRITVVRNATDTRELAQAVDDIDDAGRARARERFGVTGNRVGLFLGSMRSVRRFEMLFPAADALREEFQDFELVFAGQGERLDDVRAFCATRPWARHVGPLYDRDLAELGAISRVIVAPGWAGLVVVDSFALRTPLVVAGSGAHPPEVGYLVDRVNGRVVADEGDPGTYAQAVAEILRDDDFHAELVRGCEAHRRVYDAEGMALRFAEGIIGALNT